MHFLWNHLYITASIFNYVCFGPPYKAPCNTAGTWGYKQWVFTFYLFYSFPLFLKLLKIHIRWKVKKIWEIIWDLISFNNPRIAILIWMCKLCGFTVLTLNSLNCFIWNLNSISPVIWSHFNVMSYIWIFPVKLKNKNYSGGN